MYRIELSIVAVLQDDIYNATSYTSHDEAVTDRGTGTHYALVSELYRELTDKSQQSLTDGDKTYVLDQELLISNK
ncbi:hypothetical protein [Lactobacillus delbrueckii]|uniref:hypothetical protein n=1 Tax=Lactobacillus delbrueckii TaxID=1584 RepID=UPI002889A30A|nr:hypothetical protein [Lactobacillus delbrueckii]MCT3509582.1 hypothetical protein [Lactobacillus delbrueckii subsp. bulgaricus]